MKEGTWNTESGQVIRVALKTLNEDSIKENKVKFLQEAAIMAQFRHPNVVLLYGIMSREEPVSQQPAAISIWKSCDNTSVQL